MATVVNKAKDTRFGTIGLGAGAITAAFLNAKGEQRLRNQKAAATQRAMREALEEAQDPTKSFSARDAMARFSAAGGASTPEEAATMFQTFIQLENVQADLEAAFMNRQTQLEVAAASQAGQTERQEDEQEFQRLEREAEEEFEAGESQKDRESAERIARQKASTTEAARKQQELKDEIQKQLDDAGLELEEGDITPNMRASVRTFLRTEQQVVDTATKIFSKTFGEDFLTLEGKEREFTEVQERARELQKLGTLPNGLGMDPGKAVRTAFEEVTGVKTLTEQASQIQKSIQQTLEAAASAGDPSIIQRLIDGNLRQQTPIPLPLTTGQFEEGRVYQNPKPGGPALIFRGHNQQGVPVFDTVK